MSILFIVLSTIASDPQHPPESPSGGQKWRQPSTGHHRARLHLLVHAGISGKVLGLTQQVEVLQRTSQHHRLASYLTIFHQFRFNRNERRRWQNHRTVSERQKSCSNFSNYEDFEDFKIGATFHGVAVPRIYFTKEL